jgi:hypothetical protein
LHVHASSTNANKRLSNAINGSRTINKAMQQTSSRNDGNRGHLSFFDGHQHENHLDGNMFAGLDIDPSSCGCS